MSEPATKISDEDLAAAKEAVADMAKGPQLVETVEEIKATQLPVPKGWRMLIAIPEAEEKTAGGVLKADITKDLENTSTVIGLVLAMGSECFGNTERFGEEPWCKIGDFVLIGAYKGVRFRVHGKEFRIINDDTVQAVVDDPRGYTRA